MNQIILDTDTNRGNEWAMYAKKVLRHVDNYTIPQYGDAPNDEFATMPWTREDFERSIKKYAARLGKGLRGTAEELRDTMKICHYACMIYYSILKESFDANKDEDVAAK